MSTDATKAKSAHGAAARGDMETLRQLLFSDHSPNETHKATTSAGWTLLHTASQFDNDRVAKMFEKEDLIKEGQLDVNAKGNLDDTPLHVCAIFGSARMADWLLNQPDIDAHSVDHEGWAPIHYAARFGHLELVEMLRKKDMDGRVDEAFEGDGIVTAGKELQTIDGWTVLHVAARFEQNEIITYLLSYGVPKESKDKLGCTALHVAVKFGLIETTQHLLNHKLDVDAKTKLGESPGHLALKNMGAAEASGPRVDPQKYLRLVEVLLDRGMNMEARDHDGDTMLHCAAKRGSAAVELLCQRAANLQAKNNKGWSALHLAASASNLDAIRTLIAHGADIDIRDNDGGSWLFLLHKNDYSRVTKFLVTADASAEGAVEGPRMVLKGTSLIYTQEAEEPIKNIACERHFTMIEYVSEIASGNGFEPQSKEAEELMHYACEYGHEELIDFLIHQNVDALATNAEGLTAMHTAAKHGTTRVLDKLLAQMDINQPDDAGWTPLHHACCAGQNKMVENLLAKKADVNCQNKNLETPLHLAFGNGHMEIIRLLMEAEPKADMSMKDSIGFTPKDYATIELAERMAEKDRQNQDTSKETETKSSRCAIS